MRKKTGMVAGGARINVSCSLPDRVVEELKEIISVIHPPELLTHNKTYINIR